MESTNWLKQTNKPLFEDMLWSRPENKRFAGKLVIIGGHKQSFNDVSDAYAAALKAGVGTARVLLPQALQPMLKSVFLEAEYAPSNKIGSFSRDALAAWLEAAEWADGVLLAGDFGRNSETAVLLEGFIEKYDGLLTVAGDSLDYFLKDSENLLGRYNTVITAAVDKLQKLAVPGAVIRQQDGLVQIVNKLSIFTDENKASFITFHAGNIIVANGGRASTTPANNINQADTAAYAAVWLLQQPQKTFEALTTAVFCGAHDQQ